jgi:hypothetical protein
MDGTRIAAEAQTACRMLSYENSPCWPSIHVQSNGGAMLSRIPAAGYMRPTPNATSPARNLSNNAF